MKILTNLPKWALASIFLLASTLVHSQDKFQININDTVVARLDQIVTIRRGGDLILATKLLEQLTAQHPQYYRAKYNLGLAYADSGKSKKAIEVLLEADNLRKRNSINDVTLDNSIGWAYMLDGQNSKAEEYYKKSLQNINELSNSSQARLYNNYAQVKIYQGDYAEAEKYLNLSKAKGSVVAERTLKQILPYAKK